MTENNKPTEDHPQEPPENSNNALGFLPHNPSSWHRDISDRFDLVHCFEGGKREQLL